MRPWILALLAGTLAVASDSVLPDRVAEVVVRGAPAPVALATRAGDPYDAGTIERDVRALHATERFSDVRVESEPATEGRRLTFQLTPSPRLALRKIEVVPDNFPLKARPLQGDVIHPARARAMAEEYRREMVATGYINAAVTPELVVVAPAVADLRLHVTAGERVKVKAVQIVGDVEDIGRPALQPIKPGWLRGPAYSAGAVDAAIARVASAYVRRGYVEAVVRLDHTKLASGKATVIFAVRPGRKFAVQQNLCECLHKKRRKAEASGVLDFSARASVDESGMLTATAQQGRAYTVRRIEFTGNRRFSDASIRRNLVLNEAEAMDLRLLRKSLDRLNKSAMFEPITERDVDVRTDEPSSAADVRIHLRERKAGSWLLSGPVGPVSLAGPARFTLASRLPSWGRGLLDLSSYYASLHLGPGEVVLALQRPFVPGQAWMSGFAVGPQLGWRNMAGQYFGTQLRERFLTGESLPAPPVAVTVERGDGETLMICEAPGPRWRWLKRGLSIALQFGSVAAL